MRNNYRPNRALVSKLNQFLFHRETIFGKSFQFVNWLCIVTQYTRAKTWLRLFLMFGHETNLIQSLLTPYFLWN